MKVLLIDVCCKHGSTGKIVYDLYSSLIMHGDDASVCFGRGPRITEKNIYKFGVDWETKLHAGLARITGFNGCFSPISTKKAIGYIERYKPDIIHLHELHGYYLNYRPLLAYIKKKKIPVVWTFHCEYMYTGKCGYAYDCEKWKTTCGNCQALEEYPKSLFFDFTKTMHLQKKQMLRDLNFTIVTPSQWLADRVKDSFLGDKDIYVIHNGIDTDGIFFPRGYQETALLREKYHLDNRKIVLSVAPSIMDERKGGKEIIKIANQMPELQFVLVGADEDKRCSDNVILIHRTESQDELAAWYSIADLFLICSKKENFPTTCLEALSCGTPVVGIDEGGTRETAPYPYGRFVKGGSLELMQDEISKQLSNSFGQEEIRNMAIKLYSKNVMFESYRRLYLEVLKSSNTDEVN